MLRKIFLFLVLSFLLFATPKFAFADEDFDISTNANYEVKASGITKVSQVVKIKNKKEFIYTPSYVITTGISDVKNLATFASYGPLSNKIEDITDGGKKIEVMFPQKVIGAGNTNEFTITFETNQIARQKGSIWEVNIPGLADPESFFEYTLTLNVPQSFGAPAITKPAKLLSLSSPFTFNKNDLGKSGILLLFGESQYYIFNLSYHITNPKVVPVKTEIALPPPTSYQDVRINLLDPAPLDVYEDRDGNSLAVYYLNPKETKTVTAIVASRVFSKPVFEMNDPKGSLSYSKYWDVNDPEILKIAARLKTPQAIYNFVVGKLSYNFEKVSEKNIRLGAKKALLEPTFAVCLEFTDLFVALARAAGIKSRAIEGYAYTQNSKLRPLSLVKDILHAWPEFYDDTKKAWIMIDPTWGNTTQGMDYFNSLDFDHVAFVIKGESSTYPVPAGGYKLENDTRDVSVSLSGQEQFTDLIKTSVKEDFPNQTLSGLSLSGHVTVANKGNLPIKGKKLIIKSDLLPNYQEFYIENVLPYGSEVLTVGFSRTFFLTNRTYKVTILFDGSVTTKYIKVGMFPDYYLIALGGIISSGSIIISIVAFKTWRLYFQRRKK